MTVLTHSLALPSNYPLAEFLSFHQRDSQQLAERVTIDTLEKGFIWQGRPAHLSIQFTPTQALGLITLDPVQLNTTNNCAHWPTWLEHFLGLTQATTEFIQQHQQHPELGAVLRRQPGLRIAQTSSPFEAVSWAIIGQQISVAAALNIRRRFIELAGVQHSSGICCYPSAQQVAELSVEQLRSVGLSLNKAKAISQVSQLLSNQSLTFPEHLTADTVTQLRTELLAISGIGPWTVNYTLMRGFAWLDASLHGDAAVRRYLQVLLNQEQLSAKQTEQWLQQFSPWRSLVAAHLWQSQGFSS